MKRAGLKKSRCIDPALKAKNADAICTTEMNPVIGCDGKQYSNPCVAKRAGVTRYDKALVPKTGTTGRTKRSWKGPLLIFGPIALILVGIFAMQREANKGGK